MVEAQGKTNHKIVNTQGKARQQQASYIGLLVFSLRFACITICFVCLPKRISTSQNQQSCSNIVSNLTYQSSETFTNQEFYNGHKDLEEAENEPCLQAGFGINSSHANTDGSRKVAEARERLTKSKPERENIEVGSFQHLAH